MATRIELGGVVLEVIKKDIKNVHLSVYPPVGKVRISAPLRMSIDTIRVYAITRLQWIKQQQRKLRAQQRETPREYIDRESHYLWGKRYLLKVVEQDAPPAVELKQNKLLLKVRPEADKEKKRDILDEWYRQQLKAETQLLIKKWQLDMGVKVRQFYVQQMKTKWGSCNPASRSIRLNTELAKKPRECLEYIVVHEMAHLLEPTHNQRFVALMDRFIPRWQYYRDMLNRLPVRHESWSY